MSLAQSVFWRPGSLSKISKFLCSLYIPYVVVSSVHLSSSICFGGIKDPSVHGPIK